MNKDPPSIPYQGNIFKDTSLITDQTEETIQERLELLSNGNSDEISNSVLQKCCRCSAECEFLIYKDANSEQSSFSDLSGSQIGYCEFCLNEEIDNKK